MLSHLRFHRRGAGAGSAPGVRGGPAGPGPSSAPTSPTEIASPLGGFAFSGGFGPIGADYQKQQQHHQQRLDDIRDRPLREPASAGPDIPTSTPQLHRFTPSNSAFGNHSMGDGRPRSSGYSSLPPTLPPIARVASPEPADDNHVDFLPDLRSQPRSASSHNQHQHQKQSRHVDNMSVPAHGRSVPPTQRSPYNNMESGFIGGVALQKYKRDLQTQSSVSQASDRPPGRSRPVPAPINTNMPNTRPPPQVLSQPQSRPQPQWQPQLHSYNSTSSFVPPTGVQHASVSSTSIPVSRRPTGARLISEPSILPSASNPPEPPKTRKGLPFLKNPMSSLLNRRRNAQPTQDLRPSPISAEAEEPVYDPRIRGTRVHDFSAPRRKGPPTPNDIVPGTSQPSQFIQDELRRSATSTSQDVSHPAQASLGPGPSELTLSESVVQEAFPSLPDPQNDAAGTSSVSRPSNLQAMRPLPLRSRSDLSIKSEESVVSGYSDASTAAPSRGHGSTSVTRSRNISLSSDISSFSRPSVLPKHMKSTSSRFSFDMIGAAKQEKLLEERHRQREAEKKVTEEAGPTDSRFDDFDDDSFDYDAMMDDDGLEERIPGVNADYDEEEDYYLGEEEYLDDPDNDQDNFAGFSYQPSNGTSPLIPSSSGALGTPREGDGSAVTSPPKASPRLGESLLPPGLGQQHEHSLPGSPAAGLGIQGAGLQASEEQVFAQTGQRPDDEDLYFDGGMADEFAEDLARPPSYDATPFDESIFDNNDTDQYGRPIAGAFAQAQSERQASQVESAKRESDITSHFSTQSETTRSTAHTSVSTAGLPAHENEDSQLSSQPAGPDCSLVSEQQDPMEAYQAALAAAARDAEASGKFQRKFSQVHDDADQSPTDAAVWQPDSYEANDDDFGYENMDDFELDDDAIIAEANAEALANDADGWYGQEFGFYSASSNHHRGSRDSASSADTNYQYANGGVFGPKGTDGVHRSKSGRIVSREPNLTPITERSEYSNRNSIMSMNLPPHSFGTPVQSPGLAQLAMMDQGDEMSLSSLMRLRSKAWGGSQASLPSSSREGSPKSDRGDVPHTPWSANWSGYPSAVSAHGRKGSFLSGVSYDSDTGSIAGSPTVTVSMSTSAPVGSNYAGAYSNGNGNGNSQLSVSSQPEQLRTTNLPGLDYSSNPVSAVSSTSVTGSRRSQDGISPSVSNRRSAGGHYHRNSADSISYSKEEEESGETRWFIERRRVDESGQVEMEREAVEGGRI